jgi:hypothetical protein
MDLFGRGGAAMTRILGEGSAAVRRQIQDVNVLGKVFTDKAAKNAGVWNDMVDVLSGAWDQFKVLLMEPIRDALMPYLKSVLDWARAHPAEIRAYAERAAKAIVEAIEDLIDIGKILGRVLETIAHHLGPIMFGMAAIFAIKAIAGLVAAYNSLRLAIAATAAAQAGFSAAGLAAMAGKAGIAGLAGAGVGYGVGKLFGTSENQTSGMMWGGAGGAAAGAAIGALFGAGIGAIPGAIIGGLLGLLGGLTVGTDQDRAATEDATQSHVQYGIELLKVNDALAETQRMSADAAAGLGQVAAALAEVRDSVQFPKVTDYTQSQTRSSGGSGSGSGITIQRMELNVAPIDYNEASSAIAGKLQPKLRQAIEQQNRQLQSAAGLAAVKAGL